jgi:hypothetical protein
MKYIYILICIIVLSACNKILDAESTTDRITSMSVFASNTTAIAALNGIYSTMSTGGAVTGSTGISFLGGLSADELQLLNADDIRLQAVYQNGLVPGDVDCWSPLYNYIFQANNALIGLQRGKTDQDVQQQLTGEALFVRAFSYFYLVNLYGDVPLVLGTDYKVNAVLPRTAAGKVYDQVVADLIHAIQLLSPAFLAVDIKSVTPERVRPTSWVARALLARVYLYNKEYGRAMQQVDTILAQQELFDTVPLAAAFLRNSKEAIWQLEPKKNSYTEDGFWFGVMRVASCSDMLLQAMEEGDQRKQVWMQRDDTLYYPFKYKSSEPVDKPLEYLMVMRVGELYLVRAEARAHTGELDGAIEDLNVIRVRAGLKKMKLTTQENVLAAIAHERQVELFSEWGHRWLDLKRGGHIDEIMDIVGTKKGNKWRTYQQLYPLPGSELKANPYLKQNVGY